MIALVVEVKGMVASVISRNIRPVNGVSLKYKEYCTVYLGG